MKRYGISRIVGTGTPDDPYRPKLVNYWFRYTDADPEPPYESDALAGTVRIRRAIASDPVTGQPLWPWAFVVVDAPRLALLADDPDVRQLPDAGLDLTVGALSPTVRNKLRADFDAFGIDRSWINNSTPIRAVVRYLIQQHYATVSEDDFDPAGG